jgi:hypothetical protein
MHCANTNLDLKKMLVNNRYNEAIEARIMNSRALLLLLFVLGCATKFETKQAIWSEQNESGLEFSIAFVKVNELTKSIHTEIMVRNKYDFELVIPENSVRAFIDNEESDTAESNKRIVLPPNSRRRAVTGFKFDKDIRDVKSVVFRLEYIFKGTQSSEYVTQTAGRTIGSGIGSGYGGIVSNFGVSKSKSTSTTIEQLAYKEGERLKPLELVVPLEITSRKSFYRVYK